MKLRLIFIACSVALAASCGGATNNVASLDMTSNVWGTSPQEYRTAVFGALSEARRQGVGGDMLCGWFTNMVSYACPEVSFGEWIREKAFIIGTGMHIPEIARTPECWFSVACYYNTLKVMQANLSEDVASMARQTFLTNGNTSAYYAALHDDKRRLSKSCAVMDVMPGISNVVLVGFPSVILPKLTDNEQQEMVSNVTERAGLTESEAHSLEAFCGNK